jgi:hypothetical protein
VTGTMHLGALVEEYVAACSRPVGAAFCLSGICYDIVHASGVCMEDGWSVGDAEDTRVVRSKCRASVC